MAARKATRSAVNPQHVPIVDRQQIPKRPESKREPLLFTLRDAFGFGSVGDGGPDDTAGVERDVRSVAYLLHSLSEIGNRNLPGFAAHGLATVLDDVADRIGWRAGRNAFPDRESGEI